MRNTIVIYFLIVQFLFAISPASEYLLFSCEKGHLNNVKKILQTGTPSLHARDYFKKTPLILASENGHLEIVMALLIKGAAATIDYRDREGKSALDYSKAKGYTKIEKVLLEYGAKE
ncbi:MAG: ankyrin repeat domain-containing protein [Leptospiraceae bacterium]|nr:ankyrin repeat domain-containing protein [Leptospiraceae bacterium]